MFAKIYNISYIHFRYLFQVLFFLSLSLSLQPFLICYLLRNKKSIISFFNSVFPPREALPKASLSLFALSQWLSGISIRYNFMCF